MKFAKPHALGICALIAFGTSASVTYAAPMQKNWVGTLDLRTLPPGKRPSAITVRIDATTPQRHGAAPRLTISINGVVIGRTWTSADAPTILRAPIEDRLVSTRNRVEIAVTDTASNCPDCSMQGARLAETPRIELARAAEKPILFSQHITRLRRGVAVVSESQRDHALAAMAVAALAPHAPQDKNAPSRIVVSRDAPLGTNPPLRFDKGAVTIADRNGRTLYDRARIDRMTIVQMARTGDTPIVWVRPAADGGLPPRMELDYGNVTLFGPTGREIAFSSDQDGDLKIAYASAAEADARSWLYWRLAVIAAWLLITFGTILIVRKLTPLVPKAADA
ncbi:MAG TPA: hypothetical protein VGE05_12625 [Novosphingobium sp.]